MDLDLRAAVHVRVPGALRPHQRAGQAARPAVPHHRLRPRGRRPAHRPRGQRLEARRRGRRPLPLGGAGVLRRAQRHDARPRAAHLGLRDQLRRPRRDRARQVQPADAEAGSPQLGGGRRPRPGQLHRVPAAGVPQRRRHEAGRQRPHLGRERRTRLLRHTVRAGRRGQPDLCRLQRAEGGHLPVHGRRVDHRPQRRGLQVLEGRADPGPQGVEALRQAHPRTHRRRGHRHRLRAPRPRDLRRQRLRHPQGRHHHHLRLDLGLHARVRQPLPVDVPEADHRLALRQLPRGLGGQPADRQGQDPPDPVEGLLPGGHRPGRLRRPPQSAPGQGRGALPRPRGRPRRARRGDARAAHRRHQPLPEQLRAADVRASGRAWDTGEEEGPSVAHADVRRPLHGRGVQRAVPAQPRQGPDRTVGGVRPADADRLRPRPHPRPR
ncbi:Crotonyl-CoA carboxylase/reductase, ethylmalonyl-CoA producing [Streptomyces misionensis JCM 4497]